MEERSTMKNIETKRFILRKVEIKDAEKIYKILSNEKVIETLNMKIHKNLDDTYKLLNSYFEELDKNTKFPFAIIDKETEEFIGVFLIKLDLYNEDCFEFTIYLDEKYWGKGIYKEVLPYMIEFAFEDVCTGNFRGFVMEKNIVSAKVLEKAGFILEKIFEVPGIDGKILSFLITKEEYINRQK